MEVVEPKFTKIVDGLKGSEGPVFDKDCNFYMVAPEVTKNDSFAGQVLSIDVENNKSSVLCEPAVGGFGGVPAGCQCDKDNVLWIADMRLGLITVGKQGTFTQVCQEDDAGQTMQGCNDCTFDYDGNLWITAPAGKIAPHPYERSMEVPFGSVYCYTNQKKMVRIDTGLRFPNGIAVLHSPDGRPRTLIVAETPTKSLWPYEIEGPGKVRDRKLWGKLPGDLEGGPDGMDFDEDNNLLVAHWGSGFLEVFGSEGGSPHTRIKLPFAKVSNLHFKKGTKEVYVTEHDGHGLWRFEWQRPGKLQYCDNL